MPSMIDHLVYATPDLDDGIRELEDLVGVRATPGGQHPGRGTRNALIGLGTGMYLEIIAPDPAQPPPASPRWFGIDDMDRPRLVTWAAKSGDVDRVHRDALANNIPLGVVNSGSRRRSDDVLLSWRYTTPARDMSDGVIPFFIDWGASPHPSLTAAHGAALVDMRAEHPRELETQHQLRVLGLDLSVGRGSQPALIAVIDGRRGLVELR